MMIQNNKNFNLSNKVLFIVLLCLFILSIKMNYTMLYCVDEVNANTVVNPILDTPITIETTPRKMRVMVTNLGVSGASLYAGYYGLRSASYVSSIHTGSVGTKAALSLALFTTGGLLGLGAYAINRRAGPSGPFINVNIGGQENRRPDVDSGYIGSANCPLEVGEFVFNPFANIDPLSDNPDLALLSVSILMIVLGIQCFNFILIRMILVKYSPKILSFLKLHPFIHKLFDKLILILNKTYKLYVISFTILGYFNLIGGTIFLLLLLSFLTHSG